MILTDKNYKSTPWKNGKGITSEIAIYPPNSSMQNNDFLWRLSSAHVGEDGPFSIFSGYDRYLAVTEGRGIQLINKENLNKNTLKKNDLLFFKGDEPIDGKLLDGPIVDLNLFVKRNLVKTNFELIKEPLRLTFSSRTVFIFNVESALSVISPAGEEFFLKKGETLYLDFLKKPENKPYKFLSAEESMAFILIELDWQN